MWSEWVPTETLNCKLRWKGDRGSGLQQVRNGPKKSNDRCNEEAPGGGHRSVERAWMREQRPDGGGRTSEACVPGGMGLGRWCPAPVSGMRNENQGVRNEQSGKGGMPGEGRHRWCCLRTLREARNGQECFTTPGNGSRAQDESVHRCPIFFGEHLHN